MGDARFITTIYIKMGLEAIAKNKTTDSKTRKLVKNKLKALNDDANARNLSEAEIEILMRGVNYPAHQLQL